MSSYKGKRIVPKHCGVWNSEKEYEMLSIVYEEETGDSYISRMEVPAGTALTDTEYWALCGKFSEQLKIYQDGVDEDLAEMQAGLDADVAQMQKDVSAAEALTNNNKTVLENRMDTIEAQQAANVAASTDSDADYAAEVVDARVDADAKTYASLGAALRGVDTKKAEKAYGYGLPYSYGGWININTEDHQVEFPTNFIFFRSGSNAVLLESPDPVEYNADAILTYICYSIIDDALVTHDWYDVVAENEIVLFVLRPAHPEQSSGLFPFTVDSMQPFGSGTVDGAMLKSGTLSYNRLSSEAQAAIDAKVAEKAEKTYAYGLPYSFRGAININTTDHQIEFPSNFIYFCGGGRPNVLSSPEPIEYSASETLTYLCYNTVSGGFTTYNWASSTEEGDIVIFILCPGNPVQSSGLLPFTVDSMQPFADGTVSGSSIKDGTITGKKIAEESLDGSTLLEDNSVTEDKLNTDILMLTTNTLLPYTHYEYGSGNSFEELEDGSWHTWYTYADDEAAAYKGPGFTVERNYNRDLHIKMTYESSVGLTFYVVGGGLVKLGNIAATDGEAATVELTVPYETLNENGYTADPTNVCFTTNKSYDFVLYSLELKYYDLDGDTFLEDYESFKKEMSALEESLTENVESIGNEVDSVMAGALGYKGKKILFMGDSITALGTGTRGWPGYFNEIIEPECFVNTAVSGARWCDYSDTVYDGNPVFAGEDDNHNNTMGNQIEKLLRGVDEDNENYSYVEEYASFDMILIACGTNDATPTADIESAFTADSEIVELDTLDRTVFANAFRYVIENLQTMYPDAQIFICTPIQGYITTRSYSSIKAKGDYLKLLAGRMSVEVIDTFECGVCGIYEKKDENGRYLIDGLHPNVAGAQVMGEYNARAVISKYRC